MEFHMTTELQNRNFSIAETADYLRISKSYVWKLIGSGKLKRLKIGERSIITGRELARYLEELEAAA
jgi:excisionase family DNA binding protein